MSRVLTYGLKHRIPVLGISVVYAVLATLYHEDAQDFVRLIQRDIVWKWGSGVVGMIGIGYWGWRIRRRIGVLESWSKDAKPDEAPKERSRGGMEYAGKVWVGLIFFAVAGYVLLMSYPTEVVHYLQFGILGVLLSVALRRIDTAFVLTVVFGMLDEAYQYWWLHRHWGVYYDFNDVLLNIIAAALGLATVATLWPEIIANENITAEPQRRREKRLSHNTFVDEFTAKTQGRRENTLSRIVAVVASLRDTSYIFAVLVFVLFAVGVWTGLIAIQAADVRNHTLLLLNRMRPFETFWETFNGATAQHHVVRAWWGVLLTGLMTITGVRVVEELRKESGDRSQETGDRRQETE